MTVEELVNQCLNDFLMLILLVYWLKCHNFFNRDWPVEIPHTYRKEKKVAELLANHVLALDLAVMSSLHLLLGSLLCSSVPVLCGVCFRRTVAVAFCVPACNCSKGRKNQI